MGRCKVDDEWRLIIYNKEVQHDTWIHTFRGERVKFLYVSRAPDKTGKITIVRTDGGLQEEIYPSVVNGKIVRRQQHEENEVQPTEDNADVVSDTPRGCIRLVCGQDSQEVILPAIGSDWVYQDNPPYRVLFHANLDTPNNIHIVLLGQNGKIWSWKLFVLLKLLKYKE